MEELMRKKERKKERESGGVWDGEYLEPRPHAHG